MTNILYSVIFMAVMWLAVHPLSVKAVTPMEFQELLKDVDRALENCIPKLDSIAALQTSRTLRLSEVSSYNDSIALIDSLVRDYAHRNVDSMYRYSVMGHEAAGLHADDDAMFRFSLYRTLGYPLQGYVHEAIENLDSLSMLPLPAAQRRELYIMARRLYLTLTSIYSKGSIQEHYMKKYIAYNDSLLLMDGPREGADYHRYLGTHFMGVGEYPRAIVELSGLLDTLPPGNEGYHNTASMLAMINYLREKYLDWIYYIALTAKSELEAGYIDSECLRLLAVYLYGQGDIARSQNYTFASQDFIARSNTNIRASQYADILPVIVNSSREAQRQQSYKLTAGIVLLVVFMILLFLWTRSRVRKVKTLDALNEELVKSNVVKETYLTQFVQLYTVYFEQLDDYNRMITRKLQARQVEELLAVVKSGKFAEEQSEQFYNLFDEAFINIYPDFVQRVNDLLEPDKQFKITDPVTFTPDLRILAFLRLGIDDPDRIARFLGLSVNTIYTYRNRLRSRARNRATFEQDVMNIGRYNA